MKKNSILLFLFSGALIVNTSCNKDEEKTTISSEVKISTYSSNESHNLGTNCIVCHQQGGSGEGWFTVAGTVYDSTLTTAFPKTTIKLYTQPNGQGTLKNTIEVDALGNFYTTENIDFGTGLYPAAKGNAITKYMGSPITTGACNNCHNSNIDKIWTK